MVVKVVALCGSLRQKSWHLGLIRAAQEISQNSIKDMDIGIVDITKLPLLNPDLEVNGTYPAPVEDFRQKILAADSILFSSPEYNYSVTPLMKNALDWGSRPQNVWGGKAAAILSTGGICGGAKAQYHLRQIGIYINLHFVNKPEFYLPALNPLKFDAEGNLIDAPTKEILEQTLVSLRSFTLQLAK